MQGGIFACRIPAAIPFKYKKELSVKKLFAAASLLALLSGCASTTLATPEADAQAKQFNAQPAKARVYIYRNEAIGAAVKMNVLADNKTLGDTVAKTYIMADLEPGSHTLVGKAENDSSLTLDMVAGKIYYVWQEVKMGVLYARNKLQSVDEAEGQKGVKESQLVQSPQ